MKIYLAGKVHADCWRHTVVDDLWGCHWGDSGQISIFGIHAYMGPFFTYFGHGMDHGDDRHGSGLIDWQWVGPRDHDVIAKTDMGIEVEPDRQKVINQCFYAISQSDMIFAWIDDPSCFGTLVEIGYALSLKKRVWLASPDPPSDLWFAWHSAERRLIASDPASALRSFLASDQQTLKTMPYQDYLKTDHWKKTRKVAVEAAGGRCQICNNAGRLDVHHRTYERRGSEEPADLIALCNSCHATFHAKGKIKRHDGLT